MTSCRIMAFLVLCECVSAQETISQNVTIQLACNKAEYVCGEPVLLKTVVSNTSGEGFKSRTGHYGLSPDYGFTLYIAGADGKFENFLSILSLERTGISSPPLWVDFFLDHYSLPRDISPGGKAERVDMLMVSRPGSYRVKAVVKERDGTTYVSEPVSLQTVPLEKKDDSISKLGKQDLLIDVGLTISYYHYLGHESGDAKAIECYKKTAPVIIEQHKDSVFREYALYAEAISRCRPPSSEADVPLAERGRQLAEQFVKEYPRSWLLPDVYDKLFWVYVQQKNKPTAEDIRKKVLDIAPNASVLRELKRANIDELVR